MIEHIIYSSIMICAVLLLRSVLRNRVPNRLIYALWVIVFLRLVIPGTLYDIPIQTSSEKNVSNGEYLTIYEPLSPNAELNVNVENEIKNPNNNEDAVEQNDSIDPFAIVKTIYFVGVGAVFLWLVVSDFLVKRKLTLNRRFFEKVGGIKIFVTDSNIAPCVFGLKPSIYITGNVSNSENLDLVLMHEMTHIKHFDSYRAMARRILVAVYWWNPLVWSYMLLASRDAELACDEAVASKLNCRERLNYAKMIFEYAPRAKSATVRFGGKPMKKRITAITKESHFGKTAIALALVLSIVVCTLGFVGCEKNTPLSDGSSQIDVDNQSSIESDGEGIKWPAELLPEGFPKAPYTEIYSVEQTDDEVVIVMFAQKNRSRPIAYAYDSDLNLKYGYRTIVDMETNEVYALNHDGYRVFINSSDYQDDRLDEINKKSPTGYTYEIRVSKTDIKIESLFWTYPDSDTDLGLEYKVFEEWDETIFPENFPKPTEGLTIESIEQKSNGVFLTMTGTLSDRGQYLTEIYKSGFYATGIQPYPNDNGDYFFEGNEYPNAMNLDAPYTFSIQICKFNDKVEK